MKDNFFEDFSAFLTYSIDMLGFSLAGLGVALILLVVLTKVEIIQHTIFPFFDELTEIAKRFNEGKLEEGDPELAFAFAIYSAGIAFGVFYLIANLATPL